MIVYGRNAVREALRGPRRVREVWATAGAARELWSESLGRAAPSAVPRASAPPAVAGAPVPAPSAVPGAPVPTPSAVPGAPAPAPPARPRPHSLHVVEGARIAQRAGTDAHQGVCADVSDYVYADPAALLAVVDPFIVALDEVTDPQNLGAVCRTAECVGATGVVIPERRSAEVTPAVCKASAGAVEHLPLARVRNLADFLADAKAAGCWCYGAAAGARTAYRAPDYRGGVVLVLGAEGRGLRPRVASACDVLVGLPLRGRGASLNVSAAAAVLLYEILQQRLDATT